MLVELIAIGSFWFWAVLIAFVVLEVAAVEYDSGRLATCVLLVTIVGLALFSNVNFFGYVANHTLAALIYVVLYLVAGIAWGVAKWYFHALRAADQYRELRGSFLRARNLPENAAIADEELRHSFQREVRLRLRGAYPPVASENKARIMMWMAYWPFSAVWTLVHDPLTRFYRFAYARLATTLQAISNHAFRQFQGDFVRD